MKLHLSMTNLITYHGSVKYQVLLIPVKFAKQILSTHKLDKITQMAHPPREHSPVLGEEKDSWRDLLNLKVGHRISSGHF